MLENLSKNIIKYLVDELPPFTGIFMVQTNAEGKIMGYYGPYQDYISRVPLVGGFLHDYCPALFSMIPPLINPMVLENIKTIDEVYADIHIVESNENEYWVFFINQSHEVEKIKDILQKINTNKLKEERTKPASLDEDSLVEAIGFARFEVLDDNLTVLKGALPEWLKKLKPNFNSGDRILYKEEFPYLEVFAIEADELWSGSDDGKLKSGLWTESLPSGEDIFLTALAVNTSGTKHLLIRQMDDGLDSEQLALQMARDQKLAYEKLEKAERKLKTLLEYKDKFVSIVSHDLRSPVSAVLGVAELILNDEEDISKLSDFNRELLSNIKEEMIRLLDYNDKLYHWSNLELGNFKVVKEKLSLAKLIETAKGTAAQKMEAKNISFSSNLKANIEIEADNALFMQVLNNLVGNAVKFTPEGGNISINAEEKENDIIIKVSDTGMGMPESVAKNIFAGFARSSTKGTGGEKGTGLGLGIVKKIIDSHEFEISVESVETKGSDFIIKIPK